MDKKKSSAAGKTDGAGKQSKHLLIPKAQVPVDELTSKWCKMSS